MHNWVKVTVGIILMGLIASTSCGGKGGDGGTVPGVNAVMAGSVSCAGCHKEIYDLFQFSGHPYKLNKVENNRAPEYPYSEVPDPPEGYTWEDVAYVIGGFGWKARFVGHDGFIITGDADATTQYNLANRQWVAYHAGEEKAYDCGSCHTTGYSAAGNQDGLPGLIGTWSEPGVQCEACHGPGSAHNANPSSATINLNLDPADTCSMCHIRSDINVIDASGGFIKHHEQSEELLQSPHNGVLKCTSCHDPHASVVYRDSGHNPDGGLVAQCEDCHELQAEFQAVPLMPMAGVDCIDCHMAPLVKSAIGNLDTFTGDVSSHLFRINTSPSAPQFNADGSEAMPYINLQYACQRCHIEGGGASVRSFDVLAAIAKGYHTPAGAGQYVGSARCSTCHSGIYEKFIRSGHPYKLNSVDNGMAPEYPYSEVPNTPAGSTWNDVTYVIGGFGWKARFIRTDGFILTGDEVQYNLADGSWAAYHSGEEKPYDCGPCHTTGYVAEGNQDGLPGIIGTWAEPGVHCEACHGPGGAHVSAPSKLTINMEMDPDDACALCHIRGDINVIDAKGGFTRHHEQSEEMLQSPHNGILECTSCHDPHASAVYEDATYNPYKGIVTECATCHSYEAANQRSANMAAVLDCMDCHMPKMTKSALGNASTFTGDVAGHLWRINTDPDAPQFSPDGGETMPYVTLDYACSYCHRDGGEAMAIPLSGLSSFATGYHSGTIDTEGYVGSATCAVCHQDKYDSFILSGHPYKLNEVDGQAPVYPYSSVPNPPAGYSWNDVTYVIGGFGWKARFVGTDGYIITGQPGDGVQYNLADGSWVEYHAGEQKPYDCGSCHTTGYDPDGGNQDGLLGMIGTWEEAGVHCEACHGPGGEHAGNPIPATINKDMDPNDACALCHIRGDINVIDASGGFTKHHEQSEEMLQSPHNGILQCTSCHDPHKSVLYSDPVLNPEQGLKIHCDACHPNQASNLKSPLMESVNVGCVDCHMPPMVKSAIGDLATFTGDIAGHIWEINTDPDAPQFIPDGTQTNPYVTISYACQYCHIDGGPASTIPLEALAAFAEGYHGTADPDAFVTSVTCQACHENIYETFMLSGHSYKLNTVENDQQPTYPYSSVPNPPAGYSWSDVTYVIGGYGWKARFIGTDGYIITGQPGDGVQYNIADGSWVEYHPGEQKPYDCGPCHTTGYSPTGNQDGLPGIVGTWSEPGVHCEACHGPGGEHVYDPSPSTINIGMDPDDSCALCHIRGDVNVIDASGGFTKHHEQYEEFIQSPHYPVLECSTCHSVHKSVLYSDPVLNPEQGLNVTCEQCHPDQASSYTGTTMFMTGVICTDCHMPDMVKSAIGDLSLYTADVASHLFEINTSETAEQFSPDGTETYGYITVSYACLKCHTAGGSGQEFTVSQAAGYAHNFH